jgi:hypothetical protein
MREVDELLRRRPGLGNLAGEVQALRTLLSVQRGPSIPGASALTGTELRLLPLLCTRLSFPEVAAQMFLPAQVQGDTVYGIHMLSRRSLPRLPARRVPPSQRLAARWPSSSMSRPAELGRSALWRGRTYRA